MVTDSEGVRPERSRTGALGIVYFQGAREGNLGVARSSVPARVAAVAAFVLLALTGGPWQLLLFAAVDLAGLLWMMSALRSPALTG